MVKPSVNLREILNTLLIKFWVTIHVNMTNLLWQSYTQENILKFAQRLNVCEILILGVLLKKSHENHSKYY